MAVGVIIEIPDATREQYEAVNAKLGIDMSTGVGDWPQGLISHVGGATDDGSFIVAEVWDARASQEAFMSSSLGAALAEVGVSPPSRVAYIDPAWGAHPS